MRRTLLLLSALLVLPGCDVAVAALIASSGSDSSGDDEPVALPSTGGFGDDFARVWLADIPDDATAAIEKSNLLGNNGNPIPYPTGLWKELGSLPATAIFDPDNLALGSFNTILIQVSSDENFNLDCVEVLDADFNVVGYASGNTYGNLVTPESAIKGPPDGICAVTAASGDTRAFIFTRYSIPIDKFRINARGETKSPEPGDVLAVSSKIPSLVNQRPGGMAVNAGGMVYLTNSRGDEGYLTRFNVGGLTLPSTAEFGDAGSVQISSDLATSGSHSVAVNSAGVIYTACSNGSGTIQVRSFEPLNLGSVDSVGFTSGFNGDRVEHNSIAIDPSGNVVVVGGFSSLLSGRNHWRAKLPASLTGTPIWQSSTSLDSSSTTYWHAVTTVGNETYITGDLLSALLGGTNQIYTSIFDAAGVPTLDHAHAPAEQAADGGHAIAVDSAGNIYIGGYAGTAANGRNGILVRYEPGFLSAVEAAIVGPAGLDDEILDLAVDSDGSIFVVGYQNVSGQGENMFVRKYHYDALNDAFEIDWTRTHDGGGNDRAVSVVLTGNTVVVAGYETDGSGITLVVLRVYEK